MDFITWSQALVSVNMLESYDVHEGVVRLWLPAMGGECLPVRNPEERESVLAQLAAHNIPLRSAA